MEDVFTGVTAGGGEHVLTGVTAAGGEHVLSCSPALPPPPAVSMCSPA
jgi:hypothetical protein